MAPLEYKKISELAEALSAVANDLFHISQSGVSKKLKYSVLTAQLVLDVLATLPDEDIAFTGDNTHAGQEDFNSVVNINDDFFYNSEKLCQWYNYPTPATGSIASKTSGWTANDFTAGYLEVDFDGLVPADATMMMLFIREENTNNYVYWRGTGENIKDNPDTAPKELTHGLRIGQNESSLVLVHFGSDKKIRFTANSTGSDLWIDGIASVYSATPPT